MEAIVALCVLMAGAWISGAIDRLAAATRERK